MWRVDPATAVVTAVVAALQVNQTAPVCGGQAPPQDSLAGSDTRRRPGVRRAAPSTPAVNRVDTRESDGRCQRDPDGPTGDIGR